MQKVSKYITRLVGQYGRAGLVTQAPYAIGKNGKPLNIAHRGLAGLFPENTIPAFEAALYSGADLVELDVVFTKDDHLLVMHDPYLARITNAESVNLDVPKETRYYATEQKNITDWWTDRLKLEDLLQLKVKQKQAKNRITCLDFQFGFATLGKVI
jgi:glycerophosphoryl diester phosphodiesterase